MFASQKLLLLLPVLSLCISSVVGGMALSKLFKTADAWSALTTDQQSCTTGISSASRNTLRCEDKACFCPNRQWIADKTMDCVMWQGVMKDPLPAYNGAMTFYANECGFEPILKANITR